MGVYCLSQENVTFSDVNYTCPSESVLTLEIHFSGFVDIAVCVLAWIMHFCSMASLDTLF